MKYFNNSFVFRTFQVVDRFALAHLFTELLQLPAHPAFSALHVLAYALHSFAEPLSDVRRYFACKQKLAIARSRAGDAPMPEKTLLKNPGFLCFFVTGIELPREKMLKKIQKIWFFEK